METRRSLTSGARLAIIRQKSLVVTDGTQSNVGSAVTEPRQQLWSCPSACGIVVVLAHSYPIAGYRTGVPLVHFLHNPYVGNYAVESFFVISGLVVTTHPLPAWPWVEWQSLFAIDFMLGMLAYLLRDRLRLSFTIAALSWHSMEEPLLRLKPRA